MFIIYNWNPSGWHKYPRWHFYIHKKFKLWKAERNFYSFNLKVRPANYPTAITAKVDRQKSFFKMNNNLFKYIQSWEKSSSVRNPLVILLVKVWEIPCASLNNVLKEFKQIQDKLGHSLTKGVSDLLWQTDNWTFLGPHQYTPARIWTRDVTAIRQRAKSTFVRQTEFGYD